MLLASTQVPYGGGLVVSTLGIVIGGVLTAVIIALGGYILKRNRDFYTLVDGNGKILHRLDIALSGEETTPQNPFPAPGLIKVVIGPGGLSETMKELVYTVGKHGEILASLATGQAAGENEERRVAQNLQKP